MKFGGMIKERRIELSMTMTEVAKKVGISLPFVSDLEKGNRLLSNKETLNKLVKVLEFNRDEEIELLFKLCRERDNVEMLLINFLDDLL